MYHQPSEVSFYRLTTLPIIKAVPKLIEKIYYSGQKLVVIGQNETMIKNIDDGLWSYSTKHFIPHGTSTDPHPSDQPVYLTSNLENPNEASIAMALGIVKLTEAQVDKKLYMFDGNDQEQLEFARNKWKSYKAAGVPIIYWQQKMDGSWEKQE